jgi:hypothetical protein
MTLFDNAKQDLQGRIAKILEASPEARDSDEILTTEIWSMELAEMGYTLTIPIYKFFNMINRDRVSSMKTIERHRRKLQELHPNLRGQKWDSRHRDAETIKTNLRIHGTLTSRQESF